MRSSFLKVAIAAVALAIFPVTMTKAQDRPKDEHHDHDADHHEHNRDHAHGADHAGHHEESAVKDEAATKVIIGEKASQGEQVVVARVNGLVCDFCARAFEKVFGREDAVKTVDVDLKAKQITLVMKPGQTLSDDHILKAVKDAGYKLMGIERTL
ncbi:MAG: heavy-metal-associated domain-containing protein [Pseudomonadota bacterium]